MNIKKLTKEIKKRYKNNAEGLPKVAYDLMEDMRLKSLKLAEEEQRQLEIYEQYINASLSQVKK